MSPAQVELQGVSLVVLSFFRDLDAATDLADTVAAAGGIMGAAVCCAENGGDPNDDWTTCDRDRDMLLDRSLFNSLSAADKGLNSFSVALLRQIHDRAMHAEHPRAQVQTVMLVQQPPVSGCTALCQPAALLACYVLWISVLVVKDLTFRCLLLHTPCHGQLIHLVAACCCTNT